MKEIIIGVICFMIGASSGFMVFALCKTAKMSDGFLKYDDYELIEDDESEEE